MAAELSGVTGVIVGLAGLITGAGGIALGMRGQRKDEQQQTAKVKLEERIASFDEMESINDRLEKENARLRTLLTECEASGDLRLARQARRCRERLDESVQALSVLQSVVLSEIAKASAGDEIEAAVRHIATDHPELDDDDTDTGTQRR